MYILKTTRIIPLIALLFPELLMAQQPRLPATNLGLVNIQDGNPPGTGLFFQEIIQIYDAPNTYDSDGKKLPASDGLNTLLAIQQLIHITDVRFLNGHLGYTALLPLVKLSELSGSGQNNLSVNPNPLGDLTAGVMVQWFDRKIGNIKYAHRLELDATIPIGAYHANYGINPGANHYTISLHHAFTVFPAARLSISMRNHYHYNTRERNSGAKAGMFYHNNYSLEYALSKVFRVAATGYYLQQVQQDSYNGNTHYYQNHTGLSDTRERVLAYGLGIGYLTSNGTFLELKAVKETASVNRTSGMRATLLMNFKIN